MVSPRRCQVSCAAGMNVPGKIGIGYRYLRASTDQKQTISLPPAGSLSHLRCQLSPGGSHGVRTFPHGFVLSESACCKSLSQKSKIFASSLWQGSLWRRPWAFPFYAPNIISLAKYQSSITAQTAPSPDGRRLWGRCVKKDRCETHVLQRSILCYTCWAAFSSSSFSSWV